jgi:hypothetical protein
MEQKGKDLGLPPKLTKNFPVHKWVDLFVLYLSQKVGVCKSPLDYVVQVNAVVDPTPPIRQLGDHTMKRLDQLMAI